jgi:hypothetical protein
VWDFTFRIARSSSKLGRVRKNPNHRNREVPSNVREISTAKAKRVFYFECYLLEAGAELQLISAFTTSPRRFSPARSAAGDIEEALGLTACWAVTVAVQ